MFKWARRAPAPTIVYKPDGTTEPATWSLDHCEFCWRDLSDTDYDLDDGEQVLTEGWTTRGPAGQPEEERRHNYHWVCPACFEDLGLLRVDDQRVTGSGGSAWEPLRGGRYSGRRGYSSSTECKQQNMAAAGADVLYFEDLEEGTVEWGVECVVDMIDYALKNDPLPMHIDEQAARTSPYGSLIASSGFTISLWFRSTIPIARRLAVLGALEWRFTLPRPVYAGNRLRNKWTVVSKRVASRPGRGVVTTRQELLNERDEAVLVCDGVILIATRPG